MMEAMGFRDDEKPSDFPSRDDLVKKARVISKNVRKERGIRNGYIIPRRYQVATEAVVRENEKVEYDDVPEMVCEKLGIVPGTEMEDFPLRKQFKTKVNTVKAALRKERADAKYKMPG